MKIRNIGIIAHIDAGKTTTTERLLYHAGLIRKPGNVDSGNTTTDYLPQERERGITIKAAAISFPYHYQSNSEFMINLIDTPGHVDFGGEVIRALRVMDGVVCLLDASKGVEAQTMAGWRLTEKFGLSRLIFINKIDKVGADLEACLQSIKEKLKMTPLLMQRPVGDRSLVDLVQSLEMTWDDSGNIVKRVKNDVHRRQFLESLAEHSDAVLEKLVNEEELEEQMIKQEIANLTQSGKIVPVLYGSSLKNFGAQPILDAVCDYLPDPQINTSCNSSTSVFCFKVAFDDNRPLVFVRVYGKEDLTPSLLYNISKGAKPIRLHKLFQVRADELIPVERIPAGGIGVITGLEENAIGTGDTLSSDRSAKALFPLQVPKPVFMRRLDAPTRDAWDQLDLWLGRLSREDPSLEVIRDDRLGQTLLAGMGELHLDVIHRRLVDELRIDVHLGTVLVKKYLTLTSKTVDIPLNEKFIVRLEQLPLGEYESVQEGNVFCNFPTTLPNLRQGVEGALTRGQNGNSFIGLKCTLIEKPLLTLDIPPLTLLQVHDLVHSKLLQEPLVTLEPFVKCTLTLPPTFLGPILNDLYANRSGSLLEQLDGACTRLQLLMPLEKSVGYASWLRSLSAGNATLEMRNIGYRQSH